MDLKTTVLYDENGVEGNPIEKARLILAGQMDPDLVEGLKTDVPASNLFGVNLVLSLCAIFNLVVQCGDVSTAFLAGDYLTRELYIRLPFLGLHADETKEVCVRIG